MPSAKGSRSNLLRRTSIAPNTGDDRSTLLIDTGTGEMKLLVALFMHGRIAFHELAVYKGDTLSSARALASGDSKSFDSLMSSFAAGLDRIVNVQEDHFWGVAGALMPRSLLGATAWYRAAEGEARQEAHAFLHEFSRAFEVLCKARGLLTGLQIEIITSSSEALFEQSAIEYAVSQSTDADGHTLEAPHATIACGSGSVQITGFDATVSFGAPLKDGEALIRAGKPPTEWQARVAEAYGHCEELQALQALPASLKDRGERLKAVCISGSYYAALAAGVVSKKEDPAYKSAVGVRDLLQLLVNDPEEVASSPKDVANAARLITVIDSLFGDTLDNVELLFSRDWVLHGQPFRTTWTAGWWIEQLRGKEHPAPEEVQPGA